MEIGETLQHEVRTKRSVRRILNRIRKRLRQEVAILGHVVVQTKDRLKNRPLEKRVCSVHETEVICITKNKGGQPPRAHGQGGPGGRRNGDDGPSCRDHRQPAGREHVDGFPLDGGGGDGRSSGSACGGPEVRNPRQEHVSRSFPDPECHHSQKGKTEDRWNTLGGSIGLSHSRRESKRGLSISWPIMAWDDVGPRGSPGTG